MPRMQYWLVRPVGHPNLVRIEHAWTAQDACALAFGRGVTGFEAKSMGTRVSAVRSDRQRRAAVQSPDGWSPCDSLHRGYR